MFDAQNVVSGGNVREKCGDDEPNPDDVKPSRSAPLFPFSAEGSVSSAGKGQKAEQKPRHIQCCLKMHSFLP